VRLGISGFHLAAIQPDFGAWRFRNVPASGQKRSGSIIGSEKWSGSPTIQEHCCNIRSDSMPGGAELFPTVNGRG
jgi:hypothetical protein